MATAADEIELSYFPGCSLATSARENNRSLLKVCKKLGYRIVELEDWNCCGSSSTHSIQSDLAFHFACRNLSLAPAGRPLLVACPSCMLRLKQAQMHLKEDPQACETYERMWGRPVDPDLDIIHFFELLDGRLPHGRPGTPDRAERPALRPLLRLHADPAARDAACEELLRADGESPLRLRRAAPRVGPSVPVLRDLSVRCQARGGDTHGQPDHPGGHRRQGRLHRHGLCHVLSEPRNPLLAEDTSCPSFTFPSCFPSPSAWASKRAG